MRGIYKTVDILVCCSVLPGIYKTVYILVCCSVLPGIIKTVDILVCCSVLPGIYKTVYILVCCSVLPGGCSRPHLNQQEEDERRGGDHGPGQGSGRRLRRGQGVLHKGRRYRHLGRGGGGGSRPGVDLLIQWCPK